MRRAVVFALTLLALAGRAQASPICAVDVSANFQTAMADNRVSCGVIYAQWDAVEPTEGVYNWTTIDAAIALIPAGKTYWLDLWNASHTPAWVYADGAVAFTYIWPFAALQGGALNWPTVCSPVSTPIPWDAIYAAKWTAFLTAAAAKYAGDAKLAGIKMAPFGSYTDEMVLPTMVNAPIKNLSGQTICQSNNDIANWTAAGYTLALIQGAFNTITASYVAAFPTKQLSLQLLPTAFPFDSNIENSQLQPTVVKDLGTTEQSLVILGQKNVPHFETQNNSWQTTSIVRGVQSYQEGTSSSQQAGGQLLQFYVTLTNNIHLVPKRYEVFDIDVINSFNNSAMNVLFAFVPQRYGAGEW